MTLVTRKNKKRDKEHFRYYREILKKIEITTLLLEIWNMRIYRVKHSVTIKPSKCKPFIDDRTVDVASPNVDRASEKVKKRVLTKHPETEWIDGVKTTFKNIAVSIDSTELIAEAEY